MATPASQAQAIRVLVVDDSAFMRLSISRALNAAPGIQVVGSARDGEEALEQVRRLSPDVVTLDVEMPRLDGLGALRQIMADRPCPVIMLSSLTTSGSFETVQSLMLGAVDFVSKPVNRANVTAVMDELVKKIFCAAHANLPAPALDPARPAPAEKRIGRAISRQDRIVVIGSSTGGPRALNTVIPALPADLPAAVMVVQHMPAGFTHSLAERLDGQSSLVVKEAEVGDRLEAGKVLLAPGGYHMTIDDSGTIALNQNPPVHGVRPAIDVTLASVVKQFASAVVSVILTGMGNDGTNGCALVHQAGGRVIAEDQSSCVVYGMPRSVAEAGIADAIVPLPEIAGAIAHAAAGAHGQGSLNNRQTAAK